MPSHDRTIVHLIRHGDALPDPGGVLDGEAGYDDLGLSAKGRRQAEALGRRLAATLDLAAIYASPTRRAYETALAVAEICGRSVAADERLREIHLVDERLPPTLSDAQRVVAIRARLADLATVALRDGSWSALPDAEDADAVATRVAAAVGDAARAHPGGHVALITHAGAINAYFARLVGVRRAFFFPTGNTSLSSVRIDGDAHLLLRLNDSAHLEGLARAPRAPGDRR